MVVVVVLQALLDLLELHLQAVDGDVDRREVVESLAVHAQGLPRCLHDDLDAVRVLDARVALVAQLDLHLDDAVEEPFDPGQLLRGVLPEGVVELDTPPGEDEVHQRSIAPRRSRGPWVRRAA